MQQDMQANNAADATPANDKASTAEDRYNRARELRHKGQDLVEKQQYDDAAAAYHQSYSITYELVQSDPGNSRWYYEAWLVTFRRAQLLRRQEQYEAALKLYQSALGIIRTTTRRDPSAYGSNIAWWLTHQEIAELYWLTHREAKALASYKTGTSILSGVRQLYPDDRYTQEEQWRAYNQTGRLLTNAKRYTEAITALTHALTIAKGIAEKFDEGPEQYYIWHSLSKRANAHYFARNYADSIKDYEQAIELARTVVSVKRVDAENTLAKQATNNDVADSTATDNSATKSTPETQTEPNSLAHLQDLIRYWRVREATSRRDLARVFARKGQHNEARQNLRRAEKIFVSALQAEPKNGEWLWARWQTLSQLAGIEYRSQSFRAAHKFHRQCLAVMKQLDGIIDHQHYVRMLGITHKDWAETYFSEERYADAETSFEQALSIFTKGVEQYPTNPALRTEIAETARRLGSLAERKADYDAAFKHYSTAATQAQRLIELVPSHISWLHDRWLTHKDLGNVELQRKNHDKALQHYQAALQLIEHIDREFPNYQHGDYNRWTSLDNIGNAFIALQQYDSALAHYHEALKLQQGMLERSANYSNGDSRLWQGYHKIGKAYDELGDYQLALDSHQAALGLAKKLARQSPKSTDHVTRVWRSHNHIGDAHARLKQFDKALAAYRAGLDRMRAFAELPSHLRGPFSPSTIVTSHTKIGDTYVRMKQTIKAKKAYQQGFRFQLQHQKKAYRIEARKKRQKQKR